jgi:PKD repeat protein
MQTRLDKNRSPFRQCTLWCLIMINGVANSASARDVISLEAKDTLTALELNHGDELQFKLRSGRSVHIVLEDTRAAIVERVTPGGIVYQFSCRVRVDGQPLTLQRYVCSQECFYEPYVINGLRIWPDMIKSVFDLVPVRYPRKGNLRCVPRKAARFAIQDATLRICPEQTKPWLNEDKNFIDVGRCYNGDDCYLGPYLGQACHVGLDINHAKGSSLFAPMSFDTHGYFNSLKMGHNNNRWRGIRRWPNGDVWALQTHHLIELLVPPGRPLKIGKEYATTAGVRVGSHEHTHYEFKIGRKNTKSPLSASDDPASIACPIDFDDESDAAHQNPEVLHLDPWIVFWQIFEDRKARGSQVRASMQPLGPETTGKPVAFSSKGSRSGTGDRMTCYWTFGDGGFAIGPNPSHMFAQPGAYPVTLVVDDGAHRATDTQHISISGDPVGGSILALVAPDELSYRPRPVHATNTYGRDSVRLPHTLSFRARNSRPIPTTKTIRLENALGTGRLDSPTVRILSDSPAKWLRIQKGDDGGKPTLQIQIDSSGKQAGQYTATVEVHCADVVNSPQAFRVVMNVSSDAPKDRAVVDDRDPDFYATPSFWVGHRFSRCSKDRRGHNGFYLTNGSRAASGEFTRFTPDLKSGQYTVSLSDSTPFRSNTEFDVRVRHASGETTVRVRPKKSREIGVFTFDEGSDGFVEIHAGNSKGLVIADAVVFEPEKKPPNE